MDYIPNETSNAVDLVRKNENLEDFPPCEHLKEYLEDPSSSFADYKLPEKVFERYLPVLDIVTPLSTNSTCFTKSYGHYAEGTGSVLDFSASNRETSLNKSNLDCSKLRYFTPKEIANLMGFPKTDFSFPSNFTIKQQYRLLGNSLNVRVVTSLIKLLVYDTC